MNPYPVQVSRHRGNHRPLSRNHLVLCVNDSCPVHGQNFAHACGQRPSIHALNMASSLLSVDVTSHVTVPYSGL